MSTDREAAPTVDGPLITTAERSANFPCAEVLGVLTEQDGCLLVDGRPVFWPGGARWDAAGRAVVLEDGQRAPVDASFAGGGGYYEAGEVDIMLDERAASALARAVRVSGATTVVFAYLSRPVRMVG